MKKLKVFQIKDEIETIEMDQEKWDQNKDFIQNELIRDRTSISSRGPRLEAAGELANLKYNWPE